MSQTTSGPKDVAKIILCFVPLFFRVDLKNKMAALVSDWLRHFRLLLWNCWMEFNDTLKKARSPCPLPSLCFSSRSENQDGRPSPWLAETFSTSPLKPLNGIQRQLTGCKILTSSSKFVFYFFGWSEREYDPDLWLAEIFSHSSQKLLNGIHRMILMSPPSLCLGRSENKMVVPASEWLRHFRLLFWNCWTEFNETWQKEKTQCPLPSLLYPFRKRYCCIRCI